MLVSLDGLVDLNQNSQKALKLKSPLVDESIIKIAIYSFLRQRWEAKLFVFLITLNDLEQVLKVRESSCDCMNLILRQILRESRLGFNLVNDKLSLHK